MHRRIVVARLAGTAAGALIALIASVFAAPEAQALMSRSLVMQRAQRCVVATIPYSQTGYVNEYGIVVDSPTLGWRRDCSGFVSLCWNTSQPGYSTRTLQYISDSITKELLQPRDALVSYNRHAVLFGGWADEAHTSYYAYEMSSSASNKTGDGSVMRITPYPYWPSYHPETFIPYRLRGIVGDIDPEPWMVRVEGQNRYATACAASRSAFATGSVGTVVIASGETWPDALCAAPLAGAVRGPVLLTRPEALPTEVAREIERLGATSALVVGGPGVVGEGVLQALRALGNGLTVRRIAGPDRYATARAVAGELVRLAPEVTGGGALIATGENFPDALAASPIAYATRIPIVLTPTSAPTSDTVAALATVEPTDLLVLGGTGAVSDEVVATLTLALGLAPSAVDRIDGVNRYETALALAREGVDAVGLSRANLAIASGEGYADALAGGVAAGARGTVLLLTPARQLWPGVADELIAHRETIRRPHVLGGDGAVGPLVRQAVALALQPVSAP